MRHTFSIKLQRLHGAVFHTALAAILVMALTSQEAAAGSSWRLWSRSLLSRALLPDAVQHPSGNQAGLQLLAETHNSSLAVGSRLHAYDQCGGAGGLCNQTTIGIPCGDHAWAQVYCPTNFTCKRTSPRYWQCQLIPGKSAPADAVVVNATVAVTILPATSETANNQNWQQRGNARSNSTSQSTGGSNGTKSKSNSSEPIQANADESVVPVCGPDSMPGQSAMCVKTQTRYILPLDHVPGVASSGGAVRWGSSSMAICLLRLLSVVLAAGVAVQLQ